jgi:hypothetical protein
VAMWVPKWPLDQSSNFKCVFWRSWDLGRQTVASRCPDQLVVLLLLLLFTAEVKSF